MPPRPTKPNRISKNSTKPGGISGAKAPSDHTKILPRLKRVKGQIIGIEKMISEQRYCVDILIQFRAAMAALRGIEVLVFESHLQHCVKSALLSKDESELNRKVQELSELLSRRKSP